MRLTVIHNPAAGARDPRRYRAVLARLAAAGAAVRELATERQGDAERFASELNPGDCDRLVVAGGDGTINEAVNGLLRNRRGGEALLLALLPLGTANVLAAEIGLGNDPARLAAAILEGVPRALSLGEANGRAFLMMAGVGFDAHVVAGVSAAAKRRLGKGAYVLETLRQLRRFTFPGYRIRVGEATYDAASVIVAKGRFYAGRFLLAPEARLTDPSFQVCLFERQGPAAAAGYAAAMLLGLLPQLASLRRLPAAALEIEGPPGDPLQGDGEIIARLPAVLRVLPAALTLVHPPAAGPLRGKML